MKYVLIITLVVFFQNSVVSQTKTSKNLHSDGGGWGVKIVQESGEKTVLMIGNSVCNGFKGHLARELPDFRIVAWVNPYYLGQNNLDEDLINVLKREKYDIIHFNIGLHGWEKGRVPEGQYQPLLQKYVDTLKKYCPESKIIWASITPITNKEKPYRPNDELNPIIHQRNQIACIVMENNNIPVNDLYTLCILNMEKARGDRFHWTGPMYRMMAIQTAAKIKEGLSEKGKTESSGKSPGQIH